MGSPAFINDKEAASSGAVFEYFFAGRLGDRSTLQESLDNFDKSMSVMKVLSAVRELSAERIFTMK